MLTELKIVDRVATITIRRESCLNALSLSTLKELKDHFSALSKDEKICALIITGEGERAFCSGADLKERQDMSLSKTMDFVNYIQETFAFLGQLPMATIAAMNGVAFGGGLEMALACDIRVAAQNVQMGLSEVSLGIIPGAGGTQRLVEIVGKSFALDLILGARRVGALKAKEIGLVQYLCEEGKALEKALEIAQAISKNAPLALRAAKRAILGYGQNLFNEGLKLEMQGYASILKSKDRVEGLRAFMEKRPPVFRGE